MSDAFRDFELAGWDNDGVAISYHRNPGARFVLFDAWQRQLQVVAACRLRLHPVELAGLLEALLCEIAATLVKARSGESVHDQDHG